MTAASFEARLRRLEDIEAINTLIARYSVLINQGWNGEIVEVDRFPEIFTNDAVWRSAAMQIEAVGIDAIINGTRENTKPIAFSMHAFLNPLIEVTGDKARGEWLMWVAAKHSGHPRQVFMSQQATLHRTAEGWRIAEVDLHFGMALGPEFDGRTGPGD